MGIEHLFASIPVTDLDAARDFYARVTGREPDLIPNDREAAWQLTGTSWIYVIVDPARAGAALNTVLVDDLDAFLAGLEGRSIPAGAIETNGAGVRQAIVSDPDGNRLKIGQPPPHEPSVRQVEIRATSELPASREQVWARIVTIEGINDELHPWMRMTAPRGMSLDPAAIPLGRRWFRSWILLFGLIPVDYDDLCVERIEQPSGFLERSRMLSASVWEHERTLDELPGRGTRLSDRVSFTPRVALGAGVHRGVIAATFDHRHRRLRRFFAAARVSG